MRNKEPLSTSNNQSNNPDLRANLNFDELVEEGFERYARTKRTDENQVNAMNQANTILENMKIMADIEGKEVPFAQDSTNQAPHRHDEDNKQDREGTRKHQTYTYYQVPRRPDEDNEQDEGGARKLDADNMRKLDADNMRKLDADKILRLNEEEQKLRQNQKKQREVVEETLRREEGKYGQLQGKMREVQARNDRLNSIQAVAINANLTHDKIDRLNSIQAVAINADLTHDRARLARRHAREALNAELSTGNIASRFVKRFVKGGLFNKVFQRKYEKEIMSGKRKINANGQETTLDKLIESYGKVNINRLVKAATHEFKEEFLHSDSKDKETLTEADADVTDQIRNAITEYVNAVRAGDRDPGELKDEFDNEIKQIQAEARDGGAKINSNFHNNYAEIAKQIIDIARNEEDVAEVMRRFKVYNVDVRGDLPTKEHRDNVDKIIDRVVEGRIGRFVPVEALAVAASAATVFSGVGATAIAGPAGGILLSSVLAGGREAKRISEDRYQMQSNVAMGMEYDGLDGNPRSRREKYEAKLGATLYEHVRKATDLATDIEQALSSQDKEKLVYSLISAIFLRGYSDKTGRSLVAYSSPDERFALDEAIAEGRASFSDADKEQFAVIREQIQRSIENGDKIVENERDEFKKIKSSAIEKDRAFEKLRRNRALIMSGVTAAVGTVIGTITSVFGQEVTALLDPKKLGVIEKFRGTNLEATKETFLASHLQSPRFHTSTIGNVSGADAATRNRLLSKGYTERMVSPAHPQQNGTKVVSVPPSKSPSRTKIRIDAFANNGTKASDGNELGIINNGRGELTCALHGNSTLPNGTVINYESAVAAGKIKGILNVNGVNYEVIADRINSAGQFVFGKNGVFTTTKGETIRAMGKNGTEHFKYFRVAVDNGIDSKGRQHIFSLATELGKDNFKGTIDTTVPTYIEVPAVYEYSNTIVNEAIPLHVVPIPVVARQNIGAARSPQVGATVTGPNPASPDSDTADRTTEPPVDGSDSQSPVSGNRSTIYRYYQDPAAANTGAGASLNSNLQPNYEDYRDILGDDGVKFFTSNMPLDRNTTTRFATWWYNIDRDKRKRQAVIDLVNNTPDRNDNVGRAIRTWVKEQLRRTSP